MNIKKRVFEYKVYMGKRNYQNTTWLCFTTILYGITLFFYPENAITRIHIFSNDTDLLLGVFMVSSSIVKLLAIRKTWKKIKKISLLMILASWLLVFWSYANSPLANNSWAIAVGIVGFCYIALYRGDFTER